MIGIRFAAAAAKLCEAFLEIDDGYSAATAAEYSDKPQEGE